MRHGESLVVQLTMSDLKGLIEDAVSKGVSHEITAQRLKVERGAKMLKPSEVRKMVRCGNNRVYAALASGVLPSVLAGKGPKGERRLVRLDDTERWLGAGMPTEAAP